MKESNLNMHRSFLTMNLFMLLGLFIFSASMSYADTHIIKASNYEFDPATINAAVGDTIIWQWDGGKHTTTSSKIPDGAATWDAELKSSIKTYTYVVTVPGEYDYVCTPHIDMGMIGTINVTPAKSNQDSKDKGTNGQGYNGNDRDSYFSSPSFELISNDPELLVECLLYNRFYIK